jgi:CheY-like chemotaxis protein
VTDEGYTPLLACDGAEALTIARREQPDVILMDLMMPGMDGLAAIRALRTDATERDWCIVAMSAAANLLQAAHEVRLDGVIAKPFDIDVVLAEIAACLRRFE